MRQTAVDMENTENLMGNDGYSGAYNARRKHLVITCCLLMSYGVVFLLGFYLAYSMDVCDGSDLF